MKVVFMGTPDIVLPSLAAVAGEHGVAALFCQPDRPLGRKMAITPPAAKMEAVRLGIPVFQPESLRGGEIYNLISGLSPDVIAVMAYGKLLPPGILALPKYGCINAHASLLPKYRGAAPVQRALLEGALKTGVTVMQMDAGLDTGSVLMAEELPIGPDENAFSLFRRVSDLAAKLFIETLRQMERGALSPTPQDDGLATSAPQIAAGEAKFSFAEDASQIVNKVRAFAVWPVAWYLSDGRPVKVPLAALSERRGTPGEVLSVSPLTVAAKNGAVELREVIPSGKKRMTGAAYAMGRRFSVGGRLEDC